ncbi:MAG: PHP domain-containing protein [Candidatus Omnitrophica bacterium]|nr:PHP domain-containing protein [Candidatus Omnitrophota bacterium]
MKSQMAGLKFLRFHDLTLENIRQDCHIHTSWTDGKHSIEEIFEKAEEQKLELIALTEHIRKESTYFKDFFREADQKRQKRNLRVWIGIETKVMDESGLLDVTPEDLSLAEIVLGSVHRIPYQGDFVDPLKLGPEKSLEEEFRYSMAMIKAKGIHVLAHPFGMSLKHHKNFSMQHLEEIIRAIAKTEIAFEWNARYMNEDFFKAARMFCHKYNPCVSLGSDMHEIKDLGGACRLLQELF